MNYKKPILVDMDGVLCDFFLRYKQISKIINKEIYDGLPNDLFDVKHFYLDEYFEHKPYLQNDLEKIVDHVHQFYDLKPLENAIDGFRYLESQSKRPVYICTAPHITNLKCWTDKAAWVNKYLGTKALNNLIITKDKTLVDADFLIDDKPNISGLYDNPSWNQIVFTQKYNLETNTGFRLNDWNFDSINVLLNEIQ